VTVPNHTAGASAEGPGHQLFLAAREPVATVNHDGVQAVGRTEIQVPDLRRPARLDSSSSGATRRA